MATSLSAPISKADSYPTLYVLFSNDYKSIRCVSGMDNLRSELLNGSTEVHFKLNIGEEKASKRNIHICKLIKDESSQQWKAFHEEDVSIPSQYPDAYPSSVTLLHTGSKYASLETSVSKPSVKTIPPDWVVSRVEQRLNLSVESIDEDMKKRGLFQWEIDSKYTWVMGKGEKGTLSSDVILKTGYSWHDFHEAVDNFDWALEEYKAYLKEASIKEHTSDDDWAESLLTSKVASEAVNSLLVSVSVTLQTKSSFTDQMVSEWIDEIRSKGFFQPIPKLIAYSPRGLKTKQELFDYLNSLATNSTENNHVLIFSLLLLLCNKVFKLEDSHNYKKVKDSNKGFSEVQFKKSALKLDSNLAKGFGLTGKQDSNKLLAELTPRYDFQKVVIPDEDKSIFYTRWAKSQGHAYISGPSLELAYFNAALQCLGIQLSGEQASVIRDVAVAYKVALGMNTRLEAQHPFLSTQNCV